MTPTHIEKEAKENQKLYVLCVVVWLIFVAAALGTLAGKIIVGWL